MITNTEGFYKFENDALLHGPNYIIFPDTTEINITEKDEYTYPYNGWYYFNSIFSAKEFFGIPLSDDEQKELDND